MELAGLTKEEPRRGDPRPHGAGNECSRAVCSLTATGEVTPGGAGDHAQGTSDAEVTPDVTTTQPLQIGVQ